MVDRFPVLLSGNIAWNKLKESSGYKARVLGVTSKGLYLLLRGWVIFLSPEPAPGPLTLIVGDVPDFARLNGANPAVEEGMIRFPACHCEFVYRDAPVWSVPVCPGGGQPMSMRRHRLNQVISQVLITRPGSNSLLGAVNELIQDGGLSINMGVYSMLASLKQALIHQNSNDIVRSAIPLLGMGDGLTPSGDDLIAGLLLALNRWSTIGNGNGNLIALNQGILQNAYRSTTTLSANLIECAAAGTADEKIVAGLDGIMTGEATAAQNAGLFSGWGHHSGSDILAGIALALAYWLDG